MTDKKNSTENRRKLLKSVAAGGGVIIAGKTLPEKWSRPVIDSVALPAHAQTSGGPYSGTALVSIDSDSMFARAIDRVLPQAHAGITTPPIDVSWCIEDNEDGTAKVGFLLVPRQDGGPCWAEFWSKDNVPVGVTTPLTMSDGCSNMASAEEWLKNLGLVKDAMASDPFSVHLSGVDPGNTFSYSHTGYMIAENDILIGGICGPTEVPCMTCK